MEATLIAAGSVVSTDSRYVIVPKVTIIDQATTSSIPSQDIVNLDITFCVGDGLEGKLYSTFTKKYKGVGEDRDTAIKSAISKINPRSHELTHLITDTEKRIIIYYDQSGGQVISNAKKYASQQKFEEAIRCLEVIPNGSKYYEEAQDLSLSFAAKIVSRDNIRYLNKARSAWSASRNLYGADEARAYLNKIIVTNSYEQKEVNELITQINSGVEHYRKEQLEIELRKIDSNTAIECAKTEARAKIISSVASSAASIVSNILKW